jgi:4-amino-4-deoxy-L-arabinose transferase-like glycosyltransferase
VRPATVLWLLVLPSLLLYPALGFDLFEPDETRYAQLPREMLQRGEWVIPYLQGEPYLDKPPLVYWLVILSYRAFGVSPAAARLIPALAVHLTILLVYFLGRRWAGERAALLGALALALSPGFTGIGRMLILDGVLALWTTLALCAAYEAVRTGTFRRGWWRLAGLSCGLGVLTKGPVALLLLLPPLLLLGWLDDRSIRLRWRSILVLLSTVLLVNVPWYVAATLREPTFVKHFLWEHNVLRFVDPFDHPHGVWFYVPVVLFGLLPATLLLVPFLRFLLSGKEEAARRRGPELGFLLLTGGWCLLFFTVSGCKLPTYILPAFPPLALALGYYLANSRWNASRWTAGVAVSSFVVLAVGQNLLLPWYAHHRSPIREEAVLRQYCGDPGESVVCYPRPCSAAAFLLDRTDLKNYRSKDIEELRYLVRTQARTVILCTHRHSLEGLRELLPPEVRIVETHHFGLPDVPGVSKRWVERLNYLMGRTALGLSDLAVVEKKSPRRSPRLTDRQGPRR